MLRPLIALAFALSPLTAQDMIGVTWTGSVVAFDSFTGSSTILGGTSANMNSLARDANGTLWTVRRPAASWELATINPTTGSSTAVAPCSDIRGLAWHQGQLFAVRDGGDELVTIDRTTGAETTIGPIGYSAVQSLASIDGQLFAWDVNFGLLGVNASTGAGADVAPGFGTGGASVQWLARRADGRLVGGDTSIYVIDRTTGVPTSVASVLIGLRGAEPRQNYVRNFGTGCNGAAGQVASSASLGSGPGATLTLQSTNHAANAIGIVLFGLSNAQANGAPLPASVDPVFGTSGCTLYISPDVSLIAPTSASFPATLTLQVPVLPSWPGLSLFAQHAVLENVPGGISLSDAVVVQFGF
jgi:hypothetical protein